METSDNLREIRTRISTIFDLASITSSVGMFKQPSIVTAVAHWKLQRHFLSTLFAVFHFAWTNRQLRSAIDAGDDST
ncbi:hypothetical protein ST47_g7543 [Ascochyta rabiei]|uniref:Uncharacterized protein n=1 Tax=Didymella rabiei TaxID=5454 RepID=A0A163APD0_DIDRA|nr:hypothetical protein ST47_g7543 [Ascochyta rabiei]